MIKHHITRRKSAHLLLRNKGRYRLQQHIRIVFRTFLQINLNVQLGTELMREPILPHHLLKEIVLQHPRDPSQQIDVDAWAVEDGVHVGPLAVDLPCKLRNTHVFLVKNRLDQTTYMKLLVHPTILGTQR